MNGQSHRHKFCMYFSTTIPNPNRPNSEPDMIWHEARVALTLMTIALVITVSIYMLGQLLAYRHLGVET